MAWCLCGTSMDLVADNFAASTAALQVSKRRAGCLMHGVLCCCPVRPTPKGGSDWTDMRDLDLDLDLSWTTGHPQAVESQLSLPGYVARPTRAANIVDVPLVVQVLQRLVHSGPLDFRCLREIDDLCGSEALIGG